MGHEYKMRRKLAKCLAVLHKLDGIRPATEPTCCLFVGNGGFDNHASREFVDDIFGAYGNIKEIIMQKRRPYCFVIYDCQYSAIAARDDIHCRQFCLGNSEVRLYLAFVSEESVHSSCPTCDSVPDLLIVQDFLSDDEEKKLVQLALEYYQDKPSSGQLKNRYVKHFGYAFDYNCNEADNDKSSVEPIPEICEQLLQRAQQKGYISEIPDQLTVNFYEPGQGIPPHFDNRDAFGAEITCLSLLSTLCLDFRNSDGDLVSISAVQRSLIVMKGASRYEWTHGIATRKIDYIPNDKKELTLSERKFRISYTFRKVVRDEKNVFSDEADTVRLPSSEEEAKLLETKYVSEVYEAIAESFDRTRRKAWPAVVDFVQSLKPFSLVLELGCGNGKNMRLRSDLFFMGCDISLSLCAIAHSAGHEAFCGNCLSLPIRPHTFDAVLLVAVIHHISTQDRRKKAIENALECLKVGGVCIISVWAFEQELDKVKSHYISGVKCGRMRPEECEFVEEKTSLSDEKHSVKVHLNRTDFTEQDSLVPWTVHHKNSNRKETRLRFYHTFKKSELENLISDIDNCSVYFSVYEEGNWIVFVRKLR